MPIYQYHCEACGTTYDEFMSMADRKEKIKCKCGKFAKFKFGRVTAVAHYPLGHARVGRGRRDKKQRYD